MNAKSDVHSQVIKYIFSTQYKTCFNSCKFICYPWVYCLQVKVQGCTLTLKWRFECDKIKTLQSPSLEVLPWVMVHQTGGTCLCAMSFSNHHNTIILINNKTFAKKLCILFVSCVYALYISPCSKVFVMSIIDCWPQKASKMRNINNFMEIFLLSFKWWLLLLKSTLPSYFTRFVG